MAGQTPSSATSLAEKHFRDCFDKFAAPLTTQERKNFQMVTLKDLKTTILAIQSKQAAKSKAMNLARLQQFIEGFTQFGQVIEVFLNASEFVAFIWGPMKFLLQIASNFAESFDTLLDAYKQIGECIPLFGQYSTLFPENSHMQDALAKIYEDILEFHRRALRFFNLPTWHQFLKSIWRDFNTRFGHLLEDLRRHTDLIQRQASIVHFQHYQTDRQRLFDELGRLEITEKKRRYTEILRWASTTSCIEYHEETCKVRQDFPTTGTWLLRNQKYFTWKNDSVPNASILWLHGMPGAGKTVLASLAVEDCKTDLNADTTFFYCRSNDPQTVTCASVLKHLFCQLLKYDHDLLPWIYDEYLTSGQPDLTSVQLCRQLLRAVVLSTKKVFLVVDGLDECETDQRKLLLSIFHDMIVACDAQNPGMLRIMLVSQDEPDIRRSLSMFSEISLTSSENGDDIRDYVKAWCGKIQKTFGLTTEDTDQICDLTCGRAESMFLFAKLVMNNLCSQTTVERLREQVQPNVFPKGLGQAYERILDRIKQRPDTEVSLARTVLGWMICARRPLKWHEIQGSLSIDLEDNDVDFAERRSRIHVREVCGALVTQSPGQRLELVHSTAKHYLTQIAFVQPPAVECHLAMLCLKYLTFECFDDDLCESCRTRYVMNGHHAFQDYSITHWSDHLGMVIKNGPQGLLASSKKDRENLNSAIVNFVAKYHILEQARSDRNSLTEACEGFRPFNFFEDLACAARHIQQQKAKGPKAFDEIDPKPLDVAVLASRKVLESLVLSNTVDPAASSELLSFYGDKWFKCRRATCYYFHEGFEDDKSRELHDLRHDKPFRCPLENCESGYKLGFTTKKDLDKHNLLHHPELSQGVTIFTRLKRERSNEESESSSPRPSKQTKHPASHVCEICSRAFTRRNILESHKKSKHMNERPFNCSICDQTFARDNDRKRHEIGHSGNKKFICEVHCIIPPKIRGCGREFIRADALANHWRTGAGRSCNAPKLEEQRLQEQWENQVASIRQNGSSLPIPKALVDQYPDFTALDWHRIRDQLVDNKPNEVPDLAGASTHETSLTDDVFRDSEMPARDTSLSGINEDGEGTLEAEVN